MVQCMEIEWLKFGIAGCYSFYANKIISSGEGGLITTNNKNFTKLNFIKI